MSATPDSGSPASDKAALAYDRIDSFLRNNLDDSDYADYSEALETVYAHPPAALPDGWLQEAMALAESYGAAMAASVLDRLCGRITEPDPLRLAALEDHLKRAVP